MAKAKKSRRARRQEAEKQRQKTGTSRVVETVEVEPVKETLPEPEAVEAAPIPQIHRKAVDFAREYFYVYTDIRNIFVITLVLFVIMIGLLYII